MPNLRSLLVGVDSARRLDATCRRGLDHSHDEDKGHVQRSRRRELGERTQPPMRQPRRRGASGSRSSTTRDLAKRIPREFGPRLQPTRGNLKSPSPILAAIASPWPLAATGSWEIFPTSREISRHVHPADRLPDADLDVIDLVLLDIKAWDPERHRRVTGMDVGPTLTLPAAWRPVAGRLGCATFWCQG